MWCHVDLCVPLWMFMGGYKVSDVLWRCHIVLLRPLTASDLCVGIYSFFALGML